MADKILPSFGIDIREFDQTPQLSPSYSWKINPTRNKIAGYVDEIDGVQQATYLILKTEMGKYEIYPDWYGIELNDMYGLPRDLVRARLPKRIEEALSQDRRITGIENMNLEFVGTRCVCSFTVNCIFGEFDTEVEYEL